MGIIIRGEFLKENRLRTYYRMKLPDGTTSRKLDQSMPESRTFKITDEETFNKIFLKDKFEVDFTKEVLYLYFVPWFYTLNAYLDNMFIYNDTLYIYFEIVKAPPISVGYDLWVTPGYVIIKADKESDDQSFNTIIMRTPWER